jgi:hypothetical protein
MLALRQENALPVHTQLALTLGLVLDVSLGISVAPLAIPGKGRRRGKRSADGQNGLSTSVMFSAGEIDSGFVPSLVAFEDAPHGVF